MAAAAASPELVTRFLDRWRLRIDGDPRSGEVAVVFPVLCADGTRAALKIQPIDEETADEPAALRAWNGRGAVRLLDHDPTTGTMLLERLDATRSLDSVTDDLEALRILSELLARLVTVPPPPGLRGLGDIAAAMIDRVPDAVALLEGDERHLVETCAAAVSEVMGEPGDQLLHWDLHYENVLAGEREPWLAIDPKPLVGDPCFELLPALGNRWEDVVATGGVARAVCRRFDLMTAVLDLDRARAVRWTLGRVLQNALWDVKAGKQFLDPAQFAITEALIDAERAATRRPRPRSPASGRSRARR